MTPTFFVRALVLFNLRLLSGALLFEFSHEIDFYITYLAYDNTRLISRNLENRIFFARAHALLNLPLLPGALLFEFSLVIVPNIS